MKGVVLSKEEQNLGLAEEASETFPGSAACAKARLMQMTIHAVLVYKQVTVNDRTSWTRFLEQNPRCIFFWGAVTWPHHPSLSSCVH